MGNFGRHADALAQGRMRVNGFANVNGVSAHFNGQGYFANHVASMCANHAAAKNLAMTVRIRAIVKQQLGDPFVAPIGNGPA